MKFKAHGVARTMPGKHDAEDERLREHRHGQGAHDGEVE